MRSQKHCEQQEINRLPWEKIPSPPPVTLKWELDAFPEEHLREFLVFKKRYWNEVGWERWSLDHWKRKICLALTSVSQWQDEPCLLLPCTWTSMPNMGYTVMLSGWDGTTECLTGTGKPSDRHALMQYRRPGLGATQQPLPSPPAKGRDRPLPPHQRLRLHLCQVLLCINNINQQKCATHWRFRTAENKWDAI